MADFSTGVERMEELLAKMAKMEDGKTATEVDFEMEWVTAYGEIARRCDDLKRAKLSRYPYEAGNDMKPRAGGGFSHPEWPVRQRLEKQ